MACTQFRIEAAREPPAVAEQVLRSDREIFELTSRKDFSITMLTAKLRNAVDGCE